MCPPPQVRSSERLYRAHSYDAIVTLSTVRSLSLSLSLSLCLSLTLKLSLTGAFVIDVPATPGALNRAVEAISTAYAADGGGKPAPASKTTLRLAAGRHQLLRPLDLHVVHSGLHFQGAVGSAANTEISGGIEIPPSSWTVFAPAKCAGCGSIMRAPLAPGTSYSRQMYVNGVRANWTMGLFPQQGAKITTTGYSVPSGTFDWTHNGGAKIEMVYRGTHSSGAQWTESRVPVTRYDPATGHITMAAAGFAAGNNKAYNQHLTLPEYFQNAFELLGAAIGGRPGDWCGPWNCDHYRILAGCILTSNLYSTSQVP